MEGASVPKTRFAQLSFTGSLSAGGVAALTIALHGALLMQLVDLSERRIMHRTGWKIKSFEAINLGKVPEDNGKDSIPSGIK